MKTKLYQRIYINILFHSIIVRVYVWGDGMCQGRDTEGAASVFVFVFSFLSVKCCPFESLICQEYRGFRSIEAPPRTLEIPTLRN
jgi:hypothetical protein